MKQCTLWLSTPTAHTPLHYDSYGVNIVTQLAGQKHWFLWQPNSMVRHQVKELECLRIPYEESSIYSSYDPRKASSDSSGGKLNDMPEIKPDYTFCLGPGDVLVVPKHWWHFVETPNQVPLSLSVNLWCPVMSDKADRLSESLVRFVFGAMKSAIDSTGEISKAHGWMNPENHEFDEVDDEGPNNIETLSHEIINHKENLNLVLTALSEYNFVPLSENHVPCSSDVDAHVNLCSGHGKTEDKYLSIEEDSCKINSAMKVLCNEILQPYVIHNCRKLPILQIFKLICDFLYYRWL